MSTSAKRLITTGLIGMELLAVGGMESDAARPFPAVAPQLGAAALQARPLAANAKEFPPSEVVFVNDPAISQLYKDTSSMKEVMVKADKRLRYTTKGTRGLGAVAYHSTEAAPDGYKFVGHKIAPVACYSAELLNDIESRERSRRHLSDRTISVIALNDHEMCDSYDGVAMYGDGKRRMILNNRNLGTILHEYGHLLGGDREGLGHEMRFTCQRGPENKPANIYSAGTLQELIAEGCRLVTYTDGKDKGQPNPYASSDTVMGNGGLLNVGAFWPVFSPPEMLFLNPSLKLLTVNASPGTYYVGYGEEDTFAVRFLLPPTHTLVRHSIAPDARSIIVGPVIVGAREAELPDALSEEDTRIKLQAYVVSTNGQETTQLDISPFTRLTDKEEYDMAKDRTALGVSGQGTRPEYPTEPVIFADEELGIVVSGGRDDKGYYICVEDLHTPEMQTKMSAFKRVVSDWNETKLHAQKVHQSYDAMPGAGH